MGRPAQDTLSRLGQFEQDWMPRLQESAHVTFASGSLPQGILVPAKVADAFVEAQGLTPIGYNWEMLDAGDNPASPRSALVELASAIGQELANPNQQRLSAKIADQCADAFVDAFNPDSCTILSNRYDGLWNPISGAAVEWGFVAFDHAAIALLLFAER